MTGLTQDTWQKINATFANYPLVTEVVLYGSRAKGTYRSGSDIDLTMKGEGLNLKLLNKIANDLDDLLLPYSFDLSIFAQIDNHDLIAHISRVGKVVYRAKES